VSDRLLEDGPAEYWADDKPPTLGQLRALAAAACTALGLPAPKTRLDATTALVRLRMTEDEPQATRRAA
jgi:hypothetical protein